MQAAQTLTQIILVVATMVLSSTVHEWAHAFTATKLGDDTPRRQGRLTLNPTAHVEPLGTLIMPTIGVLLGGMLIGWARPVSFIPRNFDRRITMKTGVMLVALAGPVSNVVLAILCAALLKLGTLAFGLDFWMDPVPRVLGQLLTAGLWINTVLAVFNLLPAPPLDGFRVLEGLLPRDHVLIRWLLEYQMVAFILIIFLSFQFLHRPILWFIATLIQLFGITPEFQLLWFR